MIYPYLRQSIRAYSTRKLSIDRLLNNLPPQLFSRRCEKKIDVWGATINFLEANVILIMTFPLLVAHEKSRGVSGLKIGPHGIIWFFNHENTKFRERVAVRCVPPTCASRAFYNGEMSRCKILSSMFHLTGLRIAHAIPCRWSSIHNWSILQVLVFTKCQCATQPKAKGMQASHTTRVNC